MSTPKEGSKAPYFEGLNQHEEKINLDSFKGKKLILYFYPRDNTPGCTAEACNLNDNLSDLAGKGFEVVGVSPDSIKSHNNFIAKYELKFQLISDTDKEILQAYGAWGEKKMYGKTYMGVLRKTFIIDTDGTILKVFDKVNTKEHTKQIYEELGVE